MFELVKNSLRATVEFQMKQLGDAFEEDKLPPVSVIIADSEEMEDVVIKVSDQGGGIPRSHMPRILTYLFTTARSDLRLEDLDDLHDFGTANPLAGLGYGLPVAQTSASPRSTRTGWIRLAWDRSLCFRRSTPRRRR